jgi:hypothetical protein
MGVFPAPILERIQPASDRLVERLESSQRAKVGTPPPSMALFRPIKPMALPAGSQNIPRPAFQPRLHRPPGMPDLPGLPGSMRGGPGPQVPPGGPQP